MPCYLIGCPDEHFSNRSSFIDTEFKVTQTGY